MLNTLTNTSTHYILLFKSIILGSSKNIRRVVFAINSFKPFYYLDFERFMVNKLKKKRVSLICKYVKVQNVSFCKCVGKKYCAIS